MQTQTSNTLHNAIMEADSKDRPPMLAPDMEVLISKGSPDTTTKSQMETYNTVSQDIRDQLNAKAEAKAIERLKQGESISVQDLETNLYWEFRKFTSHDGESLELYYSMFYKMMNELIRNHCDVTNHQVNVQFLLQLQPEWQRNRGKAIVNSPQPIYDQEPSMVAEDDETSKDKEIDKLMALISLSFKKLYKPTNNNLRTSSNISRANQDNSPRINRSTGYENQRIGNVARARETVARECQKLKRVKDAAYHREKMLLCMQDEAGIQLNAEQADWRDDTDDELEDQEIEAHYMYMAQLQEVSPDVAESGPIFDVEPLQKFLNEIDRLSKEYYYADHMNAILGVYTELDEVTNLQCDYLELLEKCEYLENKLSNSKMMSKSFEALQKQAINPEIDLQQYLVQGAVTLKRVYYVEGLNHKLFSVSQFCDADLEVAFWKSRCYIRDLNGNDLLIGMYKLHTKLTQTRTSQLPQDSRKTNKRVSFSTGVIMTTSVSRPQLKSNPTGDRVMRKNSQGKKQKVEDQHRNVKLSKNKTSVTACNDSLNANTLNV
nr:integrase, catalytic region, zinc finger, CCHC-type, peptidase aspartic, catalytic [Tanacetum cinerariifolium]